MTQEKQNTGHNQKTLNAFLNNYTEGETTTSTPPIEKATPTPPPKPVKVDELEKVEKPVEPVKPVEVEKPVEPVKAAEPVKPVEKPVNTLPVKYEKSGFSAQTVYIVSGLVVALIAGAGYLYFKDHSAKPNKPAVETKAPVVEQKIAPFVAPAKPAAPPVTVEPPKEEKKPEVAQKEISVPPPPPPVTAAAKPEVKAHASEPVKVKPSHKKEAQKDAWDERLNQIEQFLKDK